MATSEFIGVNTALQAQVERRYRPVKIMGEPEKVLDPKIVFQQLRPLASSVRMMLQRLVPRL